MKSKWFELKDAAVAMRRSGMSMASIERKLGIPRSTLSGWFRAVSLTEEQRTRLMKSSQDGWKKAREKAVEWHRAQKALRLLDAKKEAQKTLDPLELSPALLDLTFAMLYLDEGKIGFHLILQLRPQDPSVRARRSQSKLWFKSEGREMRITSAF